MEKNNYYKHWNKARDITRGGNHYYVPELNEFHVGFEVRLYNEENGQHGSYIIKSDDDLTYFRDLIDLEELDVKYLDVEDIESFGFEYDNNAEPIPFPDDHGRTFEMLAFNLDTQLDNGKCYILYLFTDGFVMIDYIKDCGGQGYVFQGVIKNKSELQKVLQLTGVNG